jgi:diguanylate cyclase (GGDEF)-like protein/PAS domain S-box-containing protein
MDNSRGLENAADRRRKGPRFGANFMLVLEMSRDLVCLCENGVVIDANSAAAAMLGAKAVSDLLGRRFADFVGGDYAPVVGELLQLNDIETQPFPSQLVRLSGGSLDAELQIHPARELGGRHAMVMGRDISHQGRLARDARDSEHRFQTLVEKSMNLIAQCHGGRVIYINHTGVKMLGASSAVELKNMPVADMFQDEYREIFAEDITQLLHEPGIMPVRLARLDGSIFDAQILVTQLPSPGAVPEFMIEARDISSHLRAVAALRHMNETLESKVTERTRELAAERSRAVEAHHFVESLLEAVPNPLWWKGLDGSYRGYNQAFRDIHRIGPDDWIGKSMGDLLNPDFVAVSAKADQDALAGGGQRVQFEGRLALADGQTHDVVVSKVSWRSQEDRPEGVIGVMLDITDRKRMEAELRRMATTDVMTGVFNRRHFMATANTEIERARRHPENVSALMLDIDHFKRINDTFGHPIGDEAIKALARTCTDAIRTIDVLGRLGGEEFAVMLPDTDLDGAVLVAERIREAVMGINIPTDKGPVRFTVSIGAAQLIASDGSVDALLSRADAALYLAKNGGRNKVVAG